MNSVQFKFSSPLGAIYLSATERGLTDVSFVSLQMPLVKRLDRSLPAQRIIDDARLQLTEYFTGRRRLFSLRLDDQQGTDFQRQVWDALSKIPFGQTLAYQDIAKRIKNPRAVRAVGSANGKNPWCIVVPCHRVIASDGSIGGYSGGLSKKRQLLTLEGLSVKG